MPAYAYRLRGLNDFEGARIAGCASKTTGAVTVWLTSLLKRQACADAVWFWLPCCDPRAGTSQEVRKTVAGDNAGRINEEVTVTLKLEDKKEIVAAVNKAAGDAFSAVVADYRGLTVDQLTKLRSQAREQGVYLRVVRNTLARRAFQGTAFEILNESLVGPTIIGLSMSEDDMGAAARLLKGFAKDNQQLEIKVAAYDGRLFGAQQIDVLAKLPNRTQALTMLVSVMQAPVSKFGRLLTAIKEQKEAQAA